MNKDETITDLFELKKQFRQNAEKTISIIYNNYRESFLLFSKKITTNEELVIDAFQDAIIALYQNLIEDKITVNNSNVKTYLFEIGKHKVYNSIRKENIVVKNIERIPSTTIDLYEEDNKDSTTVNLAIAKLGKTCRNLLILYYYRKYSINAIMYELKMKTENSVKANKSRCLKQLKLLVTKSNY